MFWNIRFSLMTLSKMFLYVLIFIVCMYTCSCNSQTVTKLGSFKVPNPAFTALYVNPNATSAKDRFDLLVSSFSAIPFSADSVEIVNGVGNFMSDISGVKSRTLTKKTTWPNEVNGVPVNVFGKRMVVIPDGFLVPLKTNGGILLMDISSDIAIGPYTITDDSTGEWFYHRVKWHDMDGDGDLDAVTCHARVPIFGSKASELLWLENPNGDYTVKWKPHVISSGPDIFFEYTVLNSTDGPFDCIIVSEFFTKKLTVFWTIDENRSWTDTSKVMSRVIDDTIGSVFEVRMNDVNNDGKVDLLVTNNGNNGSVFVYEIPSDFRTGTFTRHIISTGYSPAHEGQGKGAPGSPFAAKISGDQKPIIFLSGDDNGGAYTLVPISQDAHDWRYQQTEFVENGGTMGQLAFADVDGDGKLEIFAPSYSTSEVFVFRLDIN